MPDILFFSDIHDEHARLVGGKGLSLGKTFGVGLPVPPGFVITTLAYERLGERGIRSDAEFVRALTAAYERIGGGLVAVRSSALGEDAADTSFAGQQETILGVRGIDALIAAIERCWQSLVSERAAAYRQKQQVDSAVLMMAVVVQELVPAEVAGVLFTRDPLDPDGRRMLAEAAWGLGEVVVSGRVQPDRFTLDRVTGKVLSRELGTKAVRVTGAGEEHVPPDQQRQFCLSDSELSQLAELGRKVEAYYGNARDIEWACVGETFHLLQARPITVAGAAEREQARRHVIEELRAKADPRGTVWVRYNLSEVLPEPTPMTWAVVQRLLAADGGFGAMNRDLGAKPDPALGSLSAFDLVAGRPMANLSRLPRMQFANPPFIYPFEQYKKNPLLALAPKPALDPLAGKGCVLGVLSLPGTMWKLNRMINATRRQAAEFATKFAEIVPPFVAAARSALGRDWSKLEPAALIREFEAWTTRTLIDFAHSSLKPTVFADFAWAELFDLLKPKLGEERARSAVGELSLGAAPAPEANLSVGIRELATSVQTAAEFLDRFGHRGTNEMELAQPRWSESPGQLEKLVQGAKGTDHSPATTDIEKIANEAKFGGPFRDQFGEKVKRLREFLGLREAGKHYLLLGYAVIRRALVELDRRFALNGGIFFLRPGDFPDLLAGRDLTAKITAARKRRQTELTLEVPGVLFSDDLDAIGRPAPEHAGGDRFEGVALSAGVAEGPALVLTEPAAAPPEGGYVLVCPSTDPAWVPLFVHAKALVMETGGVLSHGAIVAREFGLPAVAGLPDATRWLRTGQKLRVDGGRGIVTVLGEENATPPG